MHTYLIAAVVIIIIIIVFLWYSGYFGVSAPPAPAGPMWKKTPFTTWSDASAQCSTAGKALCSRTAICPGGQPGIGVQEGDVWTPVSDTNNEWVSIGKNDVNVRLCKTHTEVAGGTPAWGMDPAGLPGVKQTFACC